MCVCVCVCVCVFVCVYVCVCARARLSKNVVHVVWIARLQLTVCVADCRLPLLFVSKHPYLAISCWHFLLLFLASVSECFLLSLRAVFSLALFVLQIIILFSKFWQESSKSLLLDHDVITENHGFLKRCIF